MLNFRLISEFQTIHRRPFDLAAPDILKPTNVRPLIDGEWLQLTATTYQMERGGDNTVTVPGTPDDEATVPSFCVFAELGRYETQALGRVPMLYMGPYEAETKVGDFDGLSVGSKLAVFDLNMTGDTVVRRGLAAQSAGYIVGYVTRLPANNNGWLRFIHLA